MKRTLVFLSNGITCMLIGYILLRTCHNPGLLALSMFMVLLGFFPLTYVFVSMIGNVRIYRFIHYYSNSNPIDNKTQIVKRLDHKEITHLKKYNKYLFINSPILVDKVLELPLDNRTRVTGWVKASDEAEAIRTLHYTDDFDSLL